MKKDPKIKKLQVRVSECTLMRFNELAEVLGVRKGVIIRKLIEQMLDDLYDEDGYLKEDRADRCGKARSDM